MLFIGSHEIISSASVIKSFPKGGVGNFLPALEIERAGTNLAARCNKEGDIELLLYLPSGKIKAVVKKRLGKHY